MIAALLSLALVIVAIALVQVIRLSRTVDRFGPILERAEAAGIEQARHMAALESVQEAQRTAEHVLETGTSLVREVHRGIASIPFGILEAIPGANKPTRVVRSIHDAISDGVYDALSGLNKAVGREVRRGLEAKAANRPVAAPDEAVVQRPVLPDEKAEP